MSNERPLGIHPGFNTEREIPHILNDIRKWFEDNGDPETKAIIGISGGKDSTIAGKLLVEALGPKRVMGVLMPDGEQEDYDDAVLATEVLGIDKNSITINIGNITDTFRDTVRDAFHGDIPNATGAFMSSDLGINMPPRIRMAMLYAVAGSMPYGGRVINTCNASEDYIGYSTKYGDSAGDFSVLSDYTVSEIYEIGKALGLPSVLVRKKPSDGLCGLCDEDRFGFTYETLDEFIVSGNCKNEATKSAIIRMHNANLHKVRPMPVIHRLR